KKALRKLAERSSIPPSQASREFISSLHGVLHPSCVLPSVPDTSKDCLQISDALPSDAYRRVADRSKDSFVHLWTRCYVLLGCVELSIAVLRAHQSSKPKQSLFCSISKRACAQLSTAHSREPPRTRAKIWLIHFPAKHCLAQQKLGAPNLGTAKQ